MPLNKTLMTTAVGSILLFSTHLMANQKVEIIMCENCSAEETLALLKSKAPKIDCYSSDPREVMTPENEACYSADQKVLIGDALGNNHKAFFVGHNHQGMPSSYMMEVDIRDYPINATEIGVIEDVKTSYANLKILVDILQQRIDNGELLGSSSQSMPMSYSNLSSYDINPYSSSPNCPSHIEEAVDALYDGKVMSDVSWDAYVQAGSVFQDVEAAFKNVSHSSLGFGLSRTGFSYQGTFTNNTHYYKVFKPYGPMQAGRPTYQAAFHVGWDDTNKNVTARIDTALSYLDGRRLDAIMGSNQTLKLDPCLTKALAQYFNAKTETARQGGGGGSTGGGSTGGGGGGGSGGDSNTTCKQHYYDQNGVKLFTIAVPC